MEPVEFKQKRLKSSPDFIAKTGCEILGIEPVSDLRKGFDFRLPQYRKEVFLRFYEFHLKYRSHPGAVYYVMPFLAEKNNWNMEQKLWFAFINGATQNPLSSWVIFNAFPDPHKITFDSFENWHRENWRKLDYDIDRRYQKGHFVEMWQDYMKHLRGRTQEEFFGEFTKNDDPEKNFYPLWQKIFNEFFMYGRLSTFSYMEYLKIMGINVDCNYLFMDDLTGSKSHRNGMCKYLGRDDLDWHQSNPDIETHTKEIVDWLTEEAYWLREEAKLRFSGSNFYHDVNYFTLESTLCCYKSWHRENRRYPNVYNDMFYHRIKHAEKQDWSDLGINFDLFWEARKKYLPKYLRLEDNPNDPTLSCSEKSLSKEKQNHYRLTGQVIMMDQEWDCFENDFNKKFYEEF